MNINIIVTVGQVVISLEMDAGSPVEISNELLPSGSREHTSWSLLEELENEESNL